MVNMGVEKETIVIALIIGFVFVASQHVSIPLDIGKNLQSPFQPSENIDAKFEKRMAYLHVPAVDDQGRGISTILKVEAVPGEGRTLTNIDYLLFWVDTQHSIQTAKIVAANMTTADLSSIDLIYTIETQANVIEGPSAGAALALATIAVLEDKSLNPDVAITGTINPDGSIGPVGGILEKAKASKEGGAKIFLVPRGQGFQTYYSPVKQCRIIGQINYCTVEYKKQTVDITNEAGIEVREVANVREALKYFLA